MGGTDTRLHHKPMVYAHGFKTKGVMHGVNIRKMYLMESGVYEASDALKNNTHRIDIEPNVLNGGSVIVDSGTTDTYMTRSLRSPFKKLFKQVAGFDYNENGMNLREEQVYQLPTIIIQIEGHEEDNKVMDGDNVPGLARVLDPNGHPNDILVVIPPAHYIEYDSDNKKYVGRFSMTESSGSVLGANTIRGHDVFFDIPENSRIGFAPSDCDYYNLIGATDDDDSNDIEVTNNKQSVSEDDDDYYEEETSQNIEDVADVIESVSATTIAYLVGVGLIVSVAVVIYRRSSSTKGYTRRIGEEHLDDLHLDTEIENLPAIA